MPLQLLLRLFKLQGSQYHSLKRACSHETLALSRSEGLTSLGMNTLMPSPRGMSYRIGSGISESSRALLYRQLKQMLRLGTSVAAHVVYV